MKVYNINYKWGKNLSNIKDARTDKIFQCLKSLSEFIEDDYGFIVRTPVGWVLAEGLDSDVLVQISSVGEHAYISNRMLENNSNIADAFNQVANTLEGLGDICFVGFYTPYVLETEIEESELFGDEFQISTAGEKLPPFLNSPDGECYIGAESHTVLFGDLSWYSNSSVEALMTNYEYVYEDLDEAKNKITASIVQTLKSMGTELPKSAISFRKVDDAAYQVVLNFDSPETITVFRRGLVDYTAAWDWEGVLELGADHLLTGTFYIPPEDDDEEE